MSGDTTKRLEYSKALINDPRLQQSMAIARQINGYVSEGANATDKAAIANLMFNITKALGTEKSGENVGTVLLAIKDIKELELVQTSKHVEILDGSFDDASSKLTVKYYFEYRNAQTGRVFNLIFDPNAEQINQIDWHQIVSLDL